MVLTICHVFENKKKAGQNVRVVPNSGKTAANRASGKNLIT